MVTNRETIITPAAIHAENGRPFVIAWDRAAGKLTYPNGVDLDVLVDNIQKLTETAQRTGEIELWPAAVWRGKVDLADAGCMRALLEAAGINPQDMPPELSSLSPWTPFPPLPVGTIS